MQVINCKGGFYHKLAKKEAQLEKLEDDLKKAKGDYRRCWWRKVFLRNVAAGEALPKIKQKIEDLEQEIIKVKDSLYSLKKGQIGEEKVVDILMDHLDHHYALVNNFNFYVNGDRVEIDHILLAPRGLYLIETKNIKGRIYVQDEETYWFKTPLNNPDAIKTPVKNPQQQALKAKENLIRWFKKKQVSKPVLYPVVVFPRFSCLLLNRVSTSAVPVLYHDEILEYISWQTSDNRKALNVEHFIQVFKDKNE